MVKTTNQSKKKGSVSQQEEDQTSASGKVQINKEKK